MNWLGELLRMDWKAASIDDVKRIVAENLKECDPMELAIFRQYSVDPYMAHIHRFGALEDAVVVALKGNTAIYWEDVEEGFNISPIEGTMLLEHWCEQDNLSCALRKFSQGQGPA